MTYNSRSKINHAQQPRWFPHPHSGEHKRHTHYYSTYAVKHEEDIDKHIQLMNILLDIIRPVQLLRDADVVGELVLERLGRVEVEEGGAVRAGGDILLGVAGVGVIALNPPSR